VHQGRVPGAAARAAPQLRAHGEADAGLVRLNHYWGLRTKGYTPLQPGEWRTYVHDTSILVSASKAPSPVLPCPLPLIPHASSQQSPVLGLARLLTVSSAFPQHDCLSALFYFLGRSCLQPIARVIRKRLEWLYGLLPAFEVERPYVNMKAALESLQFAQNALLKDLL